MFIHSPGTSETALFAFELMIQCPMRLVSYPGHNYLKGSKSIQRDLTGSRVLSPDSTVLQYVSDLLLAALALDIGISYLHQKKGLALQGKALLSWIKAFSR